MNSPLLATIVMASLSLSDGPVPHADPAPVRTAAAGACALTESAPETDARAPRDTPVISAEPTGSPILDLQNAYRRLYERIEPSIVTVTSYVRVPEGVAFEGQWRMAEESPYVGYMRSSVASGIVVDELGTVICCRSPLVDEDGGFTPLLDVETSWGARYDAVLLASEPTINLAVIQLTLPEGAGMGRLRPVTVGSVNDLGPGDQVVAAADPFGASRTFAPGLVMAMPTAACYQSDLTGSFVHASMSVSPDAIGGGLFNASGELVGMIVPPPSMDAEERTVPEPFVTYAMQVQTALGVAEALKSKRTHESPWLGFSVLSVDELRRRTPEAATFEAIVKPSNGLYIDDVFDPSPASKAGIEVGDFVTEINGAKIMSVVDFQQALYYFSGTKVPIRFFRDGRERVKMMQIERRPVEANRR